MTVNPIPNQSTIEDLSTTEGVNKHLGGFIDYLPGGISRTMQRFR